MRGIGLYNIEEIKKLDIIYNSDIKTQIKYFKNEIPNLKESLKQLNVTIYKDIDFEILKTKRELIPKYIEKINNDLTSIEKDIDNLNFYKKNKGFLFLISFQYTSNLFFNEFWFFTNKYMRISYGSLGSVLEKQGFYSKFEAQVLNFFRTDDYFSFKILNLKEQSFLLKATEDTFTNAQISLINQWIQKAKTTTNLKLISIR